MRKTVWFKRRSFPAVLVGLAACLSLAPPARAQFAQYTAPGGPERPGEARQQRLEEALSEARWRLGPVRVEPWLGLRDVGWVDTGTDTAEDSQSRFTATAGAGLRAYLPTGPKVIWAVHALPQYVWADDEGASRLNGRYGAGFFGFFNRLTVEATATRSEELGIVTPEVLQRASSRVDRADLSAEVLVAGSVALFATTSRAQTESLVDEEQAGAVQALPLLDRTETVSRAGLRLRSRGGFVVGLGAEWSEADFDTPTTGGPALDRSNSGTAPVLEISNPEGRLVLSLDLAYRSLEPDGESTFVPYDGLTGRLQLTTGGQGRLRPTLYASRNVIYALTPPFSYAESDRAGVALTLALGRRTSLVTFAEVGRDDYAAADAELGRRDDQTAYGARLTLSLGRSASLQLGAGREEYDSSPPGLERSFTTVQVGITLGAGEGTWY